MLESTEKGGVRNSIRNCLTVFQNDPLLSGAIAKNLLTERTDIIKPIGYNRTGTAITDTDMNYLLLYLEETYGLTSEKKIAAAIGIVANENGYHPIRDYGRKRGGPRFPGDLPADSIVLRQLLHQVILQRRQLHRPHLRQHFLQDCTLLNEPTGTDLAFLDPVPCLRFLQAVLCLQQFLLCLCHKNPSSLSPLPDDFVPQCVGKLDSLRVA